MSRLQSRDQRQAAFLKLATDLHAQLEEWYDQHPAASFGEIEAEARRKRREFMGAGLAVLINGRDTGFQLEPPVCPQCAQPMAFVGYRPWRVAGVGRGNRIRAGLLRVSRLRKADAFSPGSDPKVTRGSLE